ncbi:MAG: hypothetical protein KJ583_00390 [Nanoarchaeota archaeon]|nr:hypothetical protein [Nanoarchaeota archaeon]MBU1269044.1 hypothetical protein [Nanoarchaeota archaeon]MBU1603747.1 hypothetical protein [Nanoarchaeota archaeon]MBU2443518.1 hypothetical protein [Nanoarchaeota archaeon]
MIIFQEVIDAIIMTLGVGFIFMDAFKNRPSDVLDINSYTAGFNWKDLWFASLVVAPAIILHEAAHKFVALGFGMSAVFHASYFFLALGVVLKLMNFGFIFFVPGYVSIIGAGTHLEFTLIAFAGPLIHALFWVVSTIILKTQKLNRKKTHFLILTKRINGFLFILNMLPIPGIDGFSVYSHLWNVFF